MCLIISTELDQYLVILNYLNNTTLLGTDNYPKTSTAAYIILCLYKKPTPSCQVHAPPEEFTFFQSVDTKKNNTVPGNYSRSFPEVTCYQCQEKLYYAVNCPSSTSNTRNGS